MEKKVEITSPFIRLDSLLKLAGLVQTGGHAKVIIQDGEVLLNGEVCTMRGKKCVVGDKVFAMGEQILICEAGQCG